MEPGKGDEPLRCSLGVTRLSDMPCIEAVSYTWGNNHLVLAIDCTAKPKRAVSSCKSNSDFFAWCKRPVVSWGEAVGAVLVPIAPRPLAGFCDV
jgi:hypothetical protein